VDEVSPVSDETLKPLLNARSEEGWSFESIHFVMREGSHRPTMAFVFFTQAREGGGESPGR
jgi:hypothetical protein